MERDDGIRDRYRSWGGPSVPGQRALLIKEREAPLPDVCGQTMLPFGNGRSYGDSCLNDGGVLLDCRGLNRFIGFDQQQGTIACEAGVLLADILDLTVPAGWFLAVTPGTKFVTVGGAIANDVHGKNHHRMGTFGRHVTRLELLRSDGRRLLCSRDAYPEWFAATVAGMGLTGLITWAEFQLLPIGGSAIDQETVRFSSLRDFPALARESDKAFDYSVAWIDSLATGTALGRGLLMRGNHATANLAHKRARQPHFSLPFRPPVPLINRATLRLFNALYYRKQRQVRRRALVPYDSFFYPLDSIAHWNRLYGPGGLYQHQCVLPMADGLAAVQEMLERTQAAGIGSFLTVLKLFGELPSPGLLSFPRPGLSLTLDFANSGAQALALLDDLDLVVRQAGGRVCPYKDGRMSAEVFQASFPQWRAMAPFIDPKFSSSFWRRVTRDAPPAIAAGTFEKSNAATPADRPAVRA
jgi:FAD/FMN-containing dehydrogenase